MTQPDNPHFAFPFRRSRIDFLNYDPAGTYVAGAVVPYLNELYRAAQTIGQNAVANPSFEDQTVGSTPSTTVCFGHASNSTPNLVPNPSGEGAARSVQSWSASSPIPANAIWNPNAEAGTTLWTARATNNDNNVNLIANPSGESGTPTVASASGSSTAPLNLATNPSGEAGVVITPSVTTAGATPLNMIQNPSAEVDTTDWSASGGPFTRAAGIGVVPGEASFKMAAVTITNANASQVIKQPVTVGSTYTASAYCRAPGTGRKARIDIYWFDGAGVEVSGRTSGTSIDLGTDTFTRVTTTGVAPAGAVTESIRIVYTVTIGDDLYWDRAMMTQTTVATPYFDGSTYGYKWNGTAHNSTSQPTSSIADTTAWAKVGTHASRYQITRPDNGTTLARCPTGTGGIPVVAGNWYAVRMSVHIDVLTNQTLATVKLACYWYTAAGAGSTTPSTLGPTNSNVAPGTVLDLFAIVQAPADAAFASPAVLFNGASGVATPETPLLQVADIDAVLLVDLGATTPPSSGATTNAADVVAYFDGSMTNWKWNGTAHASTSQPATATIADSTAWARVGTHSSRVTITRNDTALLVARPAIGTNGVPVVGGRWYAARVTARVDPLTPAVNPQRMTIYWYTSGGVGASTPATNGPTITVPIGTAQDFAMIAQAPPDAAFASVGALASLPATATVPITLVLDTDAYMLMDIGTSVPPSKDTTTNPADVPAYFDGATVGCTWNGTANASASTRSSFSVTDEVPPKNGTRSFRIMRDFDGTGLDSIYITPPNANRPAVTAGQYLALRASVRCEAAQAARTWTLWVQWLDAALASVGVAVQLTPVLVTPGSGWNDLAYITPAVPATAVWANFRVQSGGTVAEGETFYVDAIMAEVFDTLPASVPAYVDGSTPGYAWSGAANVTTTVFAAATVTDSTEWARKGTHASRYTVGRNDGASLAARTPTGTSGAPVVPNHYYAMRVSLRLKDYQGAPTIRSWKPAIYWYTAAGAVSAVKTVSTGPTENTPPIGAIRDMSLIAQAPSDAAFAAVSSYVFMDFGNNFLTLDLDAFMLYDLGTTFAGPTDAATVDTDVPAYFGGDTPGFVWTGTAHASTSVPATSTRTIETVWHGPSGTKSVHYKATRTDGFAINASTGRGTSGAPVTPGTRYAMQARVRVNPLPTAPTGQTTPPMPDTIGLLPVWFDASGTQLAAVSTQDVRNPRLDTLPIEYLLTAVETAPVGAAFCSVAVYIDAPELVYMTDIHVDEFMLSLAGAGDLVPPYADGSTPGYRWLGTVSNSVSQPLAPGSDGALWTPDVVGSQVALVEQDTEDHVMGCVETILRCPVGFRVERPEFGVPWHDYRQTVLPEGVLQSALREFEDRAKVTTAVTRDLETGDATVTVEVEVTSNG